jgi:hypothetical protein
MNDDIKTMSSPEYERLCNSWIGEAADAWFKIDPKSRNKVCFMSLINEHLNRRSYENEVEMETHYEKPMTREDCAKNLAKILTIPYELADKLVMNGVHSIGAMEGIIIKDLIEMGFNHPSAFRIISAYLTITRKNHE